MPVDTGPVNSILNAYFTGRQMRMSQEQQQRDAEMQQAKLQQMKFQQQIQQQEESRLQKQLDLYKTFQEQEMAHKTAQLEAERQKNSFEAHQKVLGDVAGGLLTPTQQPGEAIGSKIGGGTINGPGRSTVSVGGQNFDVSQVPSIEELQKRFAAQKILEGQITAGTEGAKAGAKAQAEAIFKKEEQDRKDKAAMERVGATNEGKLRVANINAAARRYAADKKSELDPDEVTTQGTLGWYGQTDLGHTKVDLAAKKAILDNGGALVSTKDIAKLKQLHSVDPLLDKMQSFINDLPENAYGANFMKYIGSNPLLQNRWAELNDMINAHGSLIARTINKDTGRIAIQEINRTVKGLIESGITQDRGRSRMAILRSLLSGQILEGALGGVPDKQRIDILTNPNMGHGWNLDNIYVSNGKGGAVKKYTTNKTTGKQEVWDQRGGYRPIE